MADDSAGTDAEGSDAGEIEYVLVAAVARNGVIGRDGEMPWYLPEDMKQFKRTTTGHPVVLGRKTYENVVEALGEPFPGRTSVVLSTRDLDLPEGAVLANSVAEATARAEAAAAEMGVETAYVVGGATVYEAFLPRADRMVLTELHDDYEGETTFPEFDESAWEEVERDGREAFDFVTYERAADADADSDASGGENR
ncbi:dihydrofolate reductase [Halopelagius longus]|uniref:dihydrofolate reductase n=2 Tax=Halopelagius longus TaxID=1236180 RepID=A0A1H0ZE91_9EURY|nr:dihydrofolate reductase [Halopelagius longus]RDI70239.1 dihydrofolate reductase [Halopelagius longus]SDQ25619.1 dihydrofolate reductase [Halopelagius longus]